jgi:hypothetical protein
MDQRNRRDLKIVRPYDQPAPLEVGLEVPVLMGRGVVKRNTDIREQEVFDAGEITQRLLTSMSSMLQLRLHDRAKADLARGSRTDPRNHCGIPLA